MAQTLRTQALRLSLLDGFRELAADFSAWRAHRRRFAETYAELAGLSDRELADIGIARAEIPDVARAHADLG